MDDSLSNPMRKLNDAIQMNPTNWILYINRGDGYHELGQYQQAIQDYDQAIRLALGPPLQGKPNVLAEAFNNRGLSYALMGQHQQAIDDYQQAIKWNADNRQAYVNLASTYQTIGKEDLAKEALELGSEHLRSWGWVFATYVPGALFIALLSAMIGGGWFWLAKAAWSDVFIIGGLLAGVAAVAYAIVWLIDVYLGVWDEDGKYLGGGLTLVILGLFVLIIIFEIIMGIFFRDQVAGLFNIVDWFCEEMWSCLIN